ncbi:MAG TPA: MFS transporter [Bacillales bacterium]|nr:MFS transporter [Bacillales bacterium]
MRWKDWDRNLKIRLFGEGIMNLLFWTFFPFMAIYFADSFGKEMSGVLLVASQIVSVFFGLFGGYCADRFGRKRMMFLSAVGQIVAFLLFAYANSPLLDSAVVTFISFSMLGLCDALYWPASTAMVADVVPEKHRSSVFAVFYTSINISVVIGPIIGGIFFFHYRFPLLLVCIGVSIVLAIVIKMFISETAPVREENKQPAGKKQKWYRYLAAQLSDYKVIVKDKTFLLFIVAGVLVAQTFMQLDLLMAVYTTDKVPAQTLFAIGDWQIHATGEKAFSWIVAENGFLVALFTVFMTRLMNQFRERNVFIGSALLYAVSILLFGHTTQIWVLMVLMAVFTGAELMTAGIQQGFVSKLAPEHMRGQYFAADSLRFTIGRSIAPIAIPMTVWFGYSWTFAILCILALFSAVLYFVTFNRFDKEKSMKKRKTAALP